jgi:tetratricopeptide (TPR) repeat protein
MLYLETDDLKRAAREFALADEQWKLWLSDEFVRDDLKNPLYAVAYRVYGTFLSNRGLLAYRMGDQVGARTFYTDAVALFEKLGLVREQAFPLMNLGEIDRLAGDKAKARQHFESAVAVFDKTNEAFYRTYCLAKLVTSYAETNDLEQAQRLVPELEALLGKAIPGTHPLNLAECHRNLAQCQMTLGNRAAAKIHFRKAQELAFEHSGKESEVYRNSLSGFADVLLAEGDSQGAAELLRDVLSELRVRFDSVAPLLSVQQRMNLLETLRFGLDQYLTAALEQESPERLYSQILGWKGAVGASFGRSRKTVADPEFEKLAVELDSVEVRLSRFWTSTSSVLETDKFDDVKRLALRKQEIEALVAAKWPDIAAERKPPTWDAASVSRALPPGSVLVDYFVYLHMASPAPESRVLAFVVRPEGSVAMIRLGSEDQVRESVTAWQSALKSVAGEEFRSASKRFGHLSKRKWRAPNAWW